MLPFLKKMCYSVRGQSLNQKRKVSREEGHRFTPQNMSSLLVKVKSKCVPETTLGHLPNTSTTGTEQCSASALTPAVLVGLWTGAIDLYGCLRGSPGLVLWARVAREMQKPPRLVSLLWSLLCFLLEMICICVQFCAGGVWINGALEIDEAFFFYFF